MVWASSCLLRQGGPQAEGCIYPIGWDDRQVGCEQGVARRGTLRGALVTREPLLLPPGLVLTYPLLASLSVLVIHLLRPLASLLSGRIKSGKIAGKVLAWGFSAKLN